MKIAGGTMIFEQEGNSFDGGDETIEIRVTDAGAGKFLVLKTEQWAISNKEEICALIDKVWQAFECADSTDEAAK